MAKAKFDINQMITEKIIESLEKNLVPWKKTWSGGANVNPINHVTKKAYRGINTMILWANEYESNEWLTFKQLKAKKGKLLPNQKSTPIMFFSWNKAKDKEGNEKVGENGKPIMICFTRYYNVFNLCQTDLWETEKEKIEKVKETEKEFDSIQSCEDIISGYETCPKIQHLQQSAYYSPSLDIINMPVKKSFDKESSYYATLFHEMAHSTGAEHRLAREGVTNGVSFGSHGYSKEELVAEITSSFLCAESGILNNTIDNTQAYIKSWLKVLKSDPKFVIQASQQAQKAFDYIKGVSYSK